MSRCRDDFYLWAAFVGAASAADQPSCSCSCRYHRDDREPTSEELAARPERHRAKAAARRRRYLGVLVWFLVAGALVAWAINSEKTRTRSRIQPGEPFHPIAVAAETTYEASAPGANVVDTESVLESVTMPAPLGIESPSPLLAVNLVDQTEVLSLTPPTQEPTSLDFAFFEVGSSREEVLAAQGRPPTYAAHHDRTLWWGSSRVEFDHDGRVTSWRDGTPPLNTKHQ